MHRTTETGSHQGCKHHHSGGEAAFVLCSLAWFALAGLAGPAVAQTQVTADLSDEQAASELLQVLSYDVKTMAAAGVSAGQYRAIVASVSSAISALSDQQGEQLAGARQHRRKQIAASTNKMGYLAAGELAAKHREQTLASFKALAGELRKVLTEEQRQLHNRAAADKGVGIPLALVSNLDASQVARLKREKQKHDRLAMNPRNWHRRHLQKVIGESYRTILRTTLTPGQLEELRVLEMRMQSGLLELVPLGPGVSNRTGERPALAMGSYGRRLPPPALDLKAGEEACGNGFLAELLPWSWGFTDVDRSMAMVWASAGR